MGQQNPQSDGNQQARRPSGSQRAKARASMSTEYQERFLPPHCRTHVVSTSTQKDPYHPLKATGTDVTTFRSHYVTHKWIKNPPKAPQPPSTAPKGQRRCSSAPQNPPRCAENQVARKVEDYTSVYKNDFQAWKANKRQPYRLSDSLKVNQGLVVPKSASTGRPQKNSAQVAANPKSVAQVQEPQPFESITSYRSDYVPHPVQPRTRREKPAYQPNKGLPLEPVVSLKPKVAWDMNEELFDKAGELFQQFKTWSLEKKLQGQGKGKESGPPQDHSEFLSTTHADFTAHQCQRTKPILPSMQSSEKSMEPLQATTTMKEDYKAWDTPQRFPTVPKEKMDWPKRTSFSVCTPKPAESCKTHPKPFSSHPKVNETALCHSGCSASQKPQSPAENGAFSGFECISNGNEESRRYWTTSLDRGVTWLDGDICEEPSETHEIMSCMVSGRK